MSNIEYYYLEEEGSFYIRKIVEIDSKSLNCETYSYHTAWENVDLSHVCHYEDIIIMNDYKESYINEYKPLDFENGEKVFNEIKTLYDEYKTKIKEITKSYNKRIKNIISKI